eukprot:TRINITY_DN2321_c0_g1_i1.p1 TRINITY_DN2321_c0_g1~~TRINITY_DN2321_c0_g1_i1.p1  ORF type:complete len:300 (-),score=46.64 TRINITY_DN2321_c0_g1_i1:58-858(-)
MSRKHEIAWEDINPLDTEALPTGYKALVNERKVFVKKTLDVIALQHEVSIFTAIGKHPNIVQFKGLSRKSMYEGVIILELMKMDLSRFLYTEDFKNFTTKKRINICFELAKGLKAIHKAGIIHRDIKAENVLIGKRGKCVKWTDFGLSVFKSCGVNSCRKVGNSQGNALYMAPEVWKKTVFTEKADIFGLGILFWEILNGKLWDSPKDYSDRFQYGHFICDLKKRPPMTNMIPKRIASIIKRCWNENPKKRPSCSRICREFQELFC